METQFLTKGCTAKESKHLKKTLSTHTLLNKNHRISFFLIQKDWEFGKFCNDKKIAGNNFFFHIKILVKIFEKKCENKRGGKFRRNKFRKKNCRQFPVMRCSQDYSNLNLIRSKRDKILP